MREIKFRTYLEGIGFKYFNIGEEVSISTKNGVNQFTGLFDKQGIGIYEGDIVKGTFEYNKNKDIAVVEYGEIDVSNEYDNELVVGYFLGKHCLGSHLELEVIGNIYENAELLKS